MSRILNQLNDSEKNLLFNAAENLNLTIFLFAWMFCSRISNNMINRVHKGTLREILGDNLSDFEFFLQNNNDICSHRKNIQSLMIEMIKKMN